MKRRSTKAAAIGLSTITIAGTVAFPVQIEASEVSEGSVFAPSDIQEQSVVTPEETVADNAATVAESVAETQDTADLSQAAEVGSETGIVNDDISDTVELVSQDIEDANKLVDDAATSASDVATAEQQMDASVTTAEEKLSEVAAVASDIAQATEAAKATATAAVATVTDVNTSQDGALSIIADAQTTVEQAEEQFAAAEETYNAKLAEYEAAKAEYEAAAKEYNDKKAKATDDLDKAQADYTDAQEKLAALEAQLEEAQNSLTNAGATALVAANSNESDIATYVGTIVAYYYAKNTEKFVEGQYVSNMSQTINKDGSVAVTYDILNADGSYVRSVTANYGYTIDSSNGEIRIYDTDLVYQYQDYNGNTVTITKEEAEGLKDGLIELSYWTASGFYIPSYTNGKYTYSETYICQKWWVSTWTYSYEDLTKVAAQDGCVVVSSPFEYYYLGYFIYKPGNKIQGQLANTKYVSEDALKAAILYDAKVKSGAIGIDYANSKLLNIEEHKMNATVSTHCENNHQIFSNTSKDYVSYISEITAKLNAYNELKTQVETLKTKVETAKENVTSLKNQIAQLNSANEENVAIELTRLSIELEKAQADYDAAKSNLYDAKSALAAAKAAYEYRFNTATTVQLFSSVPQQVTTDEIEADETEENDVEEETQEDEMPVVTFAASNTYGIYGGDYTGVFQNVPEEAPESEETQTIEDEETPTGITLAGLMERGKWFVGLAGVSTAGVGVAVLEAKRRAAIKLIDKLNQ